MNEAIKALRRRLEQHGVICENGSPQALREAILAAGMQSVVYGREYGQARCATFGARFETVFGEPLVSKPTRKTRGAM